MSINPLQLNTMSKSLFSFAVVWFLLASTLACSGVSVFTSTTQNTPPKVIIELDRKDKIPEQAVKISAELDDHPPLMLSPDFTRPVPVPGGVNTAGAEDSPFITPDGKTLYFFFTPDVNIPVEE